MVLVEFCLKITAIDGVGMRVSMVVNLPSRGPQSLDRGPRHVISPAPIGPGSHHGLARLPALGVQKRLGVVILALPVIVQGEGKSPVIIIEEGGFCGRAGSSGGPINRRDHDVAPGGGEKSRSCPGIVGRRNSGPVGSDGNRTTGTHVNAQGDLPVIHEGVNR